MIFTLVEEGALHVKLVRSGSGWPEECLACCIAEQLLAEEWGLA